MGERESRGAVLCAIELNQLLTTTQAASLLNVSADTVRRMCAAGQIEAVRVRGIWRVNRDSLIKFAGLDRA